MFVFLTTIVGCNVYIPDSKKASPPDNQEHEGMAVPDHQFGNFEGAPGS
jgi:hypothetical protein